MQLLDAPKIGPPQGVFRRARLEAEQRRHGRVRNVTTAGGQVAREAHRVHNSERSEAKGGRRVSDRAEGKTSCRRTGLCVDPPTGAQLGVASLERPCNISSPLGSLNLSAESLKNSVNLAGKRQREFDLGPAHGARARIAAPVHARVHAETGVGVLTVVGVADGAGRLPQRRQVAGPDQHEYNASQCAASHEHFAEVLRHDVTVPATQYAEARCENTVVQQRESCCAARTMPSTRTN
eukprot:scaffold84145_cov69-Phaeocystis_antarctica.AAC.3